MTDNYEYKTTFKAAYDTPKYGIHGVHIWFELKHKPTKTGLTFSVSTGWHLPQVRGRLPPGSISWEPMAFGVDMHTHKPNYEGQTAGEGCWITEGKCYCDGSALLGDEFLEILIAKGDEGLWERMKEQHKRWVLEGGLL